MTDAHTQQLAKKCLEQLEELVLLGKLESLHYLGDLRLRLEAIAKPPPPPVTARKPPPVPAAAVSLPRCKATWAYAGAEEDELTFQEGDQIEIIEECDPAWWRGVVVKSDGTRSRSGLFPSNYVEKTIVNKPTPKSSSPPPARNLPPVYTPSVHSSSDHAPSTYSFHSPDNERNMQGYQGQSQVPMNMPSPYDNSNEKPQNLGVAPWQPGQNTHWSSGSPIPAPPPPPPQQYQQGYNMPPSLAPSNQSYYQQQHNPEKMEMQQAAQGPSNPALYGTQQPVPPDHAKNDKLKKFGGRMGQTLATSFVGGVGFGVGSHLF